MCTPACNFVPISASAAACGASVHELSGAAVVGGLVAGTVVVAAGGADDLGALAAGFELLHAPSVTTAATVATTSNLRSIGTTRFLVCTAARRARPARGE